MDEVAQAIWVQSILYEVLRRVFWVITNVVSVAAKWINLFSPKNGRWGSQKPKKPPPRIEDAAFSSVCPHIAVQAAKQFRSAESTCCGGASPAYCPNDATISSRWGRGGERNSFVTHQSVDIRCCCRDHEVVCRYNGCNTAYLTYSRLSVCRHAVLSCRTRLEIVIVLYQAN